MDAHFGGRMKKLELSLIRLDGDTQVRQELNQTTVDSYAELIQDGVSFTPVTVFYDGSDHWLSSGFHRYFAHKKAGHSEIDAEVITGTLEEAKLHAIQANNKNGLPLTNNEKRQNVTRLLGMDLCKDWSNAQIAAHAGVSSMTVSRIRAERGRPEKVTYTTKDGQQKKMRTSKIGKKNDAPKAEPPSENAKFEEAAAEFDENEAYVKDLEMVNENLQAEVTKLKDVIAVQSWDASEFEKLDAEQTIAELREKIRLLEIDNEALRTSRDMFQRENAELIRVNRSLQNKLKKAA
jgi:hypothetical protein